MQLKARVVLYDREYGSSSGYRGSADVELILPDEMALKVGFQKLLKPF